MVVVSLRRLPPSGCVPREEAVRVRRPSLPVIPQKSQLAMSSVGHQRSRRPSLWEDRHFHHPFDAAANRYGTELEGYCYAVFPDGEEVPVRVDRELRLFELFEDLLRSRHSSINDVAIYVEGSHTPVPETSDSHFFIGRRLLILRRGAMRVGRHSRATHSMDDSPNDRPSRKMSAEAVSRKSSFANSRMLAKSRQHSENKLFNGSDETADGRSIDSSLRDISIMDDASTSSEMFDDGGTRRARSVTSSRISLWGFGKEKNEVLARLEDFKADTVPIPPELDIEKSWTDIVQGYQSLPKRSYEKQEALWELITTEKSYIEVLKNMSDLKGYLHRLQDANLLREIVVDKVFRNYDQLYAVHLHYWVAVVYPMLLDSRHTGAPLDAARLSPWFTEHKWARSYSEFTHKHNDSLLYLQKKRKDNQVFAEFVSWAESQQAMRRQKLTDTLTMPMQRLTRYSLLLKAVLRSSGNPEEGTQLQMMIDSIEDAARMLNTEMDNNDIRLQLEEMQRQFDGYDCIDQEEFEKITGQKCVLNLALPMFQVEGSPPTYRRLIHRGELRMKEGKQGTKPMDVYCMLFTDMFLICRKKGDRYRVIRNPIHMVESYYGPHNSNETSFFILQVHPFFNTCSQLYIMQASGIDDAARWFEVLEHTWHQFHQMRDQFNREIIQYHRKFDSPMEERREGWYTPPPPYNRFSQQYRPQLPGVSHRKSSSMDSQTVAAQHGHMHRVATVCSTEQLDRVTDRLDSPSRQPPRHKLSVASCIANPLSGSKSSVDLHLGGEPLVPVTRTRSRSNSSGPEVDGQRRSRSPSPFANGTSTPNGCETGAATPVEEEQPTSHGRRFEKRYHTADGIEVKPRGIMSQGILKRFSLNVSSAVGGSSRKISARLGEHSRRHSQASTVASTESFGSSTSGISSASDGIEPHVKCHVTSVAVNESPSESTLNISLDLLDADVAEEKRSPPAPPLPEIPPPSDAPEEIVPPPLESNSNGKELLKYLMEQNLETSDV